MQKKERNFPKIMGILNVTPDSFSDGGWFFDKDAAIKQGLQLFFGGADIIDIGGESTRPGSESVNAQEEINRVLPVIKGIKKEIPESVISIDTSKYNVAMAAADAGAEVLNDVTALSGDERLADIAAKYNMALILMHMQGTPRIMQQDPKYDNVIEDIIKELAGKIQFAKEKGVKSIIADPGIGFGKTLEHNLEILRKIDRFSELHVPLALGISRKSFIGKTAGIDTPSERDVPTALIHALLLKHKIDIIRVHNVRIITLLKKFFNVLY